MSPHLYDLQHLIAADVAVAVQVVHAERPLELLLQLATRRHAQRDDELPEVYRAVCVGVERAEDMLGELGGVAVGEEVGVDLLELLHVEVAAGAVLQEALGSGRREERREEDERGENGEEENGGQGNGGEANGGEENGGGENGGGVNGEEEGEEVQIKA